MGERQPISLTSSLRTHQAILKLRIKRLIVRAHSCEDEVAWDISANFGYFLLAAVGVCNCPSAPASGKHMSTT